MAVESLLVVYCVLIVTASVLGGQLSTVFRMTHLRTQVLMSFVGGLMLGIAMLHLLPHANDLLKSSTTTCTAVLFGIVSMFLLLRMFHQHHHHGPPGVDAHASCSHEHHIHGVEHEAEDEKTQDHSHSGQHDHSEREATIGGTTAIGNKGLGWVGMLFGLGLHTLVDGVALAASALAEAHHGPWLGLAGLGTFLAVALHKPLDAFAITSTMKASGWSTGHQNLANALFSIACPIGALVFYFGSSGNTTLLGWGLAISAGFFVCIALADLLPEVAFHDHDRGKLTAALFIGIGLAVLIESLPGHTHDGDHSHSLYGVKLDHRQSLPTASPNKSIDQSPKQPGASE